MLNPTTSPDSHNAISSPGLAFGRMHCGGPGGETTRQFGQALAHANLSARQAKEMGLLTSGIYGPHGSILSRSAALNEFLASKLQAATASLGSTLYKLTWKQRATPQGRLIYALRASAHRTSGNAFTSWPTPAARDYKDGQAPSVVNSTRTDKLPHCAQLTGRPTPRASEAAHPGRQANTGHKGQTGLAEATSLTSPHAARLTVLGEMLTGSTAATTNGGQLNPAHPRWLLGLPQVWDDCAVMAMQSLAKTPSK